LLPRVIARKLAVVPRLIAEVPVPVGLPEFKVKVPPLALPPVPAAPAVMLMAPPAPPVAAPAPPAPATKVKPPPTPPIPEAPATAPPTPEVKDMAPAVPPVCPVTPDDAPPAVPTTSRVLVAALVPLPATEAGAVPARFKPVEAATARTSNWAAGAVRPMPTLPFNIVYPVPPGVSVMFGLVPTAAIARLPVDPTVKLL